MSETGKPDDNITLAVKGHAIRIKFETACMVAIMAVALLGCAIGVFIIVRGNKDMADRMSELTGSILGYLGVLVTGLGGSWARGHMDKRVEDQ